MTMQQSREQAAYRLGVDVGGTFTDLLLIDQRSGKTFAAKVPSTPKDSSIGVMNGIARVCDTAGIDPGVIHQVMHGTTVATNAVLTRGGAKVALVTTKGYRHVLQIDRSYVPGGLGGWVIWNKRPLLAPLEHTVEAVERIGARGEIVTPLDEAQLKRDLQRLVGEGIEAVTVSLYNAYANGAHEQRVRAIVEDVLPGLPVSISSEVVPEMYEYERTETTVVNSYVRPIVSRYVKNLTTQLADKVGGGDVRLHILRSDGGLASAANAQEAPVNLLLSGPAGGVSGAIWAAGQAGFTNLLTFDMGGTSTDVALIQNGQAQKRRETRVADVAVRASSIDVRTVGAGGGSIAYVPELTKALRVGPQSAGADPGPAAYNKGGKLPTVTDANCALGYLPLRVRLGGDMEIRTDLADQAVQSVADALNLPLKDAAEGIIRIVNENMFGALRLVSVEQGFDPRDFALVAFGGAGPLHANALGILTGAWPVIIPPGPGILCAYGDATTRLRDEHARTWIRRLSTTRDDEVQKALQELAERGAKTLSDEGVAAADQAVAYEIDIRYRGQGTSLTVALTPDEFAAGGLKSVAQKFDKQHEQLFTFALDAEHELVNLRALVQGPAPSVSAGELPRGDGKVERAKVDEQTIHYDGKSYTAGIYDRSKLLAGDVVPGPAIVVQMDTTTLILPGHAGEVEPFGNILIRPVAG